MKKVISLFLILSVSIVLIIMITRNMKDTTVRNNISDSIIDLQPTKILPERLNILEGVSLVYIEHDKEVNAIKFILHNNRSDTIYYGEEIILEKNHNGEWYEIPYSGEIGFTSILNYLSPLDESERSIPMSVWESVTPGEYRIICEVSTKEYYKNLYPISADFTIGK